MTELTRVERLQAELDSSTDTSPLGDLFAVWAGLADALWLGTLRAALDPTPPVEAPYPALKLAEAPVLEQRRERAA